MKMIIKKQAQYVEQSKLQKCKDCSMFHKPDKCKLVMGEINVDAHCKYWVKIPVKNED